MLERKNRYYVVRDYTDRIIYKGKDEKKAQMFQSRLDKQDAIKEKQLQDSYDYHLARLLGKSR